MEQPAGKEDSNAGEKKDAPADPIPGHPPGPIPKAADDEAFKSADNDDDNATVDIDLNGGDVGEKESQKPAAAVLKSKKSVHWNEELVSESPPPRDMDRGSNNPYVNYSPANSASGDSSSFNFKETMTSVKDVLGRWGKKVGEATKKAEDLAGNTWQHRKSLYGLGVSYFLYGLLDAIIAVKTNPSLADAALGRIAQGTKVLAEGGYEKIFRQTFETVPEEQLINSYACYLSTSAGPVMGILYVSTAKFAFCSDNPLPYKSADNTEWSYYKVVIPLHQLKTVNPSSSRTNQAEKYIQAISVDNHEFWYMGFLNYNGAVKCMQDALQGHDTQSV